MKKLKRGILLLSIISTVLTIVNISTINQYQLLPLLPLIYGCTFYLFIPNHTIIGGGFTMLTIVLSLRYLVYPILFVYDNIGLGLERYFSSALLLMIIEILVINLTIRHFYRKKNLSSSDVKIKSINPFIPVVLLVLIFLTLWVYPMAYSNRHFILSSENISDELSAVPGYISQPMKWAELIIVVFIFSILYQKYRRSGSIVAFYGSIVVIMLPCMYFTGHSRLSLLMPLICTIFMLRKIYREKAKGVLLGICAYGVIAIVVLSLQKFYGNVLVSTAASELSPNANANLLNAYFGGVKNVMIGLKAYDIEGSSIAVAFHDLFRNVMGISGAFVDNPHNSVTIFNTYFYGSSYVVADDQICPTVIEGMLAFGPLGALIPTIIMVHVTCWLDRKWNDSNSLEYSYLYAFVGTLIGWCVPGNFMHLSSTFFNIMVPVSLLILLNQKLSSRKN